jgi:RNA polymerase sigma-70 factor (ECF subfamily)
VSSFTSEALASLRPRLIAFCYQMLGSPFDAEDAVQDVMERAWRARESYDSSLASLSTWCYRIAHNVCVDRLRGAPRRPLPRDLQDPGIEIGAPLVPALDVPWLMPAPSSWNATSEVGTALERATDMRLAVTALLQALPARQRGAFVLREGLGLTAAETAEVLRTSVSAVNSALQRARSTLGAAVGPSSARAPFEREQVERYARAIERADVETLAALVADDVVLEMPPVAAWSRGRRPFREFMAHLFSWRGTAWQTSPVMGNGQCGLLLYLVTAGGADPHSLQLFDTDETGAISHVLVYRDPRLFALFESHGVEIPGVEIPGVENPGAENPGVENPGGDESGSPAS